MAGWTGEVGFKRGCECNGAEDGGGGDGGLVMRAGGVWLDADAHCWRWVMTIVALTGATR